MIVRKNAVGAGEDAAQRIAGVQDSARAGNMVAEGVSTWDLEVAAVKMMADAGAKPAFKDYSCRPRGTVPFVLCTSVNEEIVHGMPSRSGF
jgi:methionine aminopeptidase